jgi:Mg-chelatase subunit ChlD
MPAFCVKNWLTGGIAALCVAAGCSGSPDPEPGDATFGGNEASGGSAATSTGGASSTSSGGTTINVDAAGAGGDPGIGEECARSTAKAEPAPANLLFVIDTSGSMSCNPPDGDAVLGARCARFPIKEDPSRPSKWEVTKQALSSALSGLVDRPRLQAGLTLFPSGSECGVSAAPSVPLAMLDQAQLGAIDEALDKAVPDGETPLAGATILSYAYLADELRAGRLSGNSFVILLTDGSETCAPAVLDPLVDMDVPNARLFDIRTFVIGAPGSEQARRLLSRVAFEGGTSSSEACDHVSDADDVGDCHFDVTRSADFESELAAALDRISRVEQLACTLEVPKNPDGGEVDLARVNVTFIPKDEAPERIVNDLSHDCADGADGWQYSADHSQILLCGAACSKVQERPGELQVVLGCPTEVVR